jgi:hypothetical protein
MTDYVKSTNFTSKDSLATGNPLKIVKGAEFDVEFNNIATAVATKADLANPTLTGVPAAPTASAGTNTTQIATTAFVTDAVATGKVNTALTGVPTAPTAAVNTNTTQVATTAFVTAQIADDAPTKTGTGASGTWGINITGNAATVTSVTAAQVLGATTGAQAGDVGSYAFLSYIVNTPVAVGTLIAGSSLRYRGATSSSVTSGISFDAYGSSAPAGTWRLMGYIEGYYEYYGVNGNHSSVSSLWLRIS